MASEAVVDLVVNTAGADEEIRQQLTRIVAEAERSTRPVQLDVDGSGAGSRAGSSFLASLGSVIRSGIGSALSGALSGLRSVADAIHASPQTRAIGVALAAGAAAAFSPAIGALLSGAVIAVSGLTFIGIGAALLASEPDVSAAATRLKDRVIEIFRTAAEPMRQPFIDALNSFRDTANAIAPQISQIFAASAGFIQPLADGINLFVRNTMPGLLTAVQSGTPVFNGLRDALATIGTGLSNFFTQISAGGPGAGAAIRDLGSAIAFFLTVAGRIIGDLARAYAAIRSFVSDSVGSLESFRATGERVISGFLTSALSFFERLRTGAERRVRDLVSRAVEFLRGLPGRALSAVEPLSPRLASAARQAGDRLVSRLRTGVSEAITVLRSLPGRAREELGDLSGRLFSSGRALVQGFVDGIRSMIGRVADAASSVVSAARDFFPFSPAKRGPFSGRGYTSFSGQALIRDFAEGMLDQRRAVEQAANQVLQGASLGALTPSPAAPTTSAAGVTSPFFSLASAAAPSVNVFLGNELINRHIDVRIDRNNVVRDRQADQGVRF